MLLSPKQIEFVRCANHRWNFKGGATRSGKTYLDFKWIIPMRIRERVGMDGLSVILGVTKSTIERNVLEPMRNIYGDELVGVISSDNTARIFGEKCYCLGAEKISQVSKLRGASFKYCYGDEVADWSEDVFTLLKSRLDKDYSCFDGTFNPQHPDHWLKQFLDSDADIFSQTYTIDDNPFLPEAFKENLKREYAGTVFYDRYILGLWTRAEGLVYPMFNSEKNIFLSTAQRELIMCRWTMEPSTRPRWDCGGCTTGRSSWKENTITTAAKSAGRRPTRNIIRTLSPLSVIRRFSVSSSTPVRQASRSASAGMENSISAMLTTRCWMGFVLPEH